MIPGKKYYDWQCNTFDNQKCEFVQQYSEESMYKGTYAVDVVRFENELFFNSTDFQGYGFGGNTNHGLFDVLEDSVQDDKNAVFDNDHNIFTNTKKDTKNELPFNNNTNIFTNTNTTKDKKNELLLKNNNISTSPKNEKTIKKDKISTTPKKELLLKNSIIPKSPVKPKKEDYKSIFGCANFESGMFTSQKVDGIIGIGPSRDLSNLKSEFSPSNNFPNRKKRKKNKKRKFLNLLCKKRRSNGNRELE